MKNSQRSKDFRKQEMKKILKKISGKNKTLHKKGYVEHILKVLYGKNNYSKQKRCMRRLRYIDLLNLYLILEKEKEKGDYNE